MNDWKHHDLIIPALCAGALVVVHIANWFRTRRERTGPRTGPRTGRTVRRTK